MLPFERVLLRGCRGLIEPGARVIVGLSGGADSSALLAGLAALRERLGIASLEAAHLDHGIRGLEAARDARAARDLAERLGVGCALLRADAPAELASRAGGSLEAAARTVRYRALAELAAARAATHVAVAHTADDQAETVLLRLVRGAGLPGLSGIPRRRRLTGCAARLVRPLLSVRRAAGVDYLRARGLTWVEDGSNQDRRFLRARVRHDLLPGLRSAANPEVDQALLRLARQARRARRLLDRQARELLQAAQAGDGWRLDALNGAEPATRAAALHRLLRAEAPARASAAHVEALLRLVRRGAGQVDLAGGRWSALEGRLVSGPIPAQPAPGHSGRGLGPAPLDLPVPGQLLDAAAGLLFTTRLSDWTNASPPADDPACAATLDAERLAAERPLEGALGLRRRRAGDRFWPLGAPGARTLKRFFNDRKVPRPERASVPVVTLDDRPVWIVGHRIDERYKVTPATRRVLYIEARRVRGREGSGR